MSNSVDERLHELNETLNKEGFSTDFSKETSTIYFDEVEAYIQVKSDGEFEILEGIMSVQKSESVSETVDKIREMFSRV